jgi:ribosomal protein S18 acetylase RimI-like enzyme
VVAWALAIKPGATVIVSRIWGGAVEEAGAELPEPQPAAIADAKTIHASDALIPDQTAAAAFRFPFRLYCFRVDQSREQSDHPLIRRIRAQDWRALRRCRLRALLLDAPAFGTALADAAARPDQHWRELAHSHAEGPDRSILVAVGARDVVAMIRIEREQPPERFGIYSLWVSPEQRRRGLAARLLAEAESWAVAGGGTQAELFVLAAAHPARALYERSGYVVNGRTDDDRDDHAIEVGMEKSLVDDGNRSRA